MDLHALAIADSQKIHNGTLGPGGFNVSAKFTDIGDPTQFIDGVQILYSDVSLNINPENGQAFIGAKVAFSFQQSDLTIWDGKASISRWKVEFTNGAGQALVCEIESVAPDRSFGSVLCFCKIISGHR